MLNTINYTCEYFEDRELKEKQCIKQQSLFNKTEILDQFPIKPLDKT